MTDARLSNKIISTRRTWRRFTAVVFSAFRFLVLFGLIFMIVYPFIFMFVTAFRSIEDLNDPGVVWITRHYTLDNFKTFLKLVDFGDMMANTITISLGAAVLQTFFCGLTGYGFARFRFKGRNFWFALLLFTLIVPSHTYIMQQFMMFRNFNPLIFAPVLKLFTGKYTVNILDTAYPFLIQSAFGLGIRSGLFIYIYRQFFRGLPSDLEDAAHIDGSNTFSTYFKVMLPNAVPAIVTVFMLSLVWNWNDDFNQSFLSMSRNTVAVYLTQIRGSINTLGLNSEDPTYLYIIVQSGALLCILPLLLLFAFGQRSFTESIERTGIVG